MLQTFENLIAATAQSLVATFSPLRARVKGEGEARRAQVAQLLGMNPVQLLCGVGFNQQLARVPDLSRFLGYSGTDALLAERNYEFIHDRYRNLSVNNVVEIYAALGQVPAAASAASDLVISRLSNIEAQLEETINPILIGGYKLEVRGIYENRLAGPALLNARLDLNYAVLREITNESMIMLETGIITPAAFLRHAGVTADEKSRAIFQRLIPRDAVLEYLDQQPPPADAAQLKAALAGAS